MQAAKVEGYDSLAISENGQPSSLDNPELKQRFQDSFDLSGFNLNLLTSEERQAEIKRCKNILLHYSRMMYLISSNSGWNVYGDSVNFNFIANTKKMVASTKQDFDADMGVCWSIKPLYGAMSDFFYPFTYRIKPYVILMSVMNVCSCLMVTYCGLLTGNSEPTYNFLWLSNIL